MKTAIVLGGILLATGCGQGKPSDVGRKYLVTYERLSDATCQYAPPSYKEECVADMKTARESKRALDYRLTNIRFAGTDHETRYVGADSARRIPAKPSVDADRTYYYAATRLMAGQSKDVCIKLRLVYEDQKTYVNVRHGVSVSTYPCGHGLQPE